MPSTAHIDLLNISHDDARDQALVLLARHGDRGALSQLLCQHQDRVFAMCLRMCSDPELASDLTQETMLKAIKGLDQFNARSKFSTWLTRVAINVCLTSFRKARLRRSISLEAIGGDLGASGTWGNWLRNAWDNLGGSSLFGLSSGESAGVRGIRGITESREPEAPERIEKSESTARLREALALLDPEQRALLILRDMHGLGYQTIAEVLDVPTGTVKRRLFRARSALRDIYSSIGGTPPAGP